MWFPGLPELLVITPFSEWGHCTYIYSHPCPPEQSIPVVLVKGVSLGLSMEHERQVGLLTGPSVSVSVVPLPLSPYPFSPRWHSKDPTAMSRPVDGHFSHASRSYHRSKVILSPGILTGVLNPVSQDDSRSQYILFTLFSDPAPQSGILRIRFWADFPGSALSPALAAHLEYGPLALAPGPGFPQLGYVKTQRPSSQDKRWGWVRMGCMLSGGGEASSITSGGWGVGGKDSVSSKYGGLDHICRLGTSTS